MDLRRRYHSANPQSLHNGYAKEVDIYRLFRGYQSDERFETPIKEV